MKPYNYFQVNNVIWRYVYVGNGIEPTPHSLKIERTCAYDHEILKNTKQTEQDNPCLWFLFYFYFAFHKNLAVTYITKKLTKKQFYENVLNI